MELSKHNALQIVREINSVLPQKINLMNQHGIIIASTDDSRIGTYHGGAAKVTAENLDELRIFRDDEYIGTRRGTNFLLRVQGEPIGVLGITGPYEEILSIARIIKKMTEILVNEQELLKQHARVESSRTQFLNEWLTHSEKFINKAFLDRGLALGIDIRQPRRCLVVSLEPLYRTQAETVHTELKKQLLLLEPAALLCETITETILLVPAHKQEILREFAQHLKNAIEIHCSAIISIGIDSPAPDYLHMHAAYLQAQKALQSSLRMQKVPIKFYDEINMEIFADEIPDAAKLQYIHRIFRGYDSTALEKTIAMLEIFYEEDGSITKTAARLFIHKNTLQQHLRKIAVRTSYDPRSLRDSAVFYITIYFYRDITNSGQSI